FRRHAKIIYPDRRPWRTRGEGPASAGPGRGETRPSIRLAQPNAALLPAFASATPLHTLPSRSGRRRPTVAEAPDSPPRQRRLRVDIGRPAVNAGADASP